MRKLLFSVYCFNPRDITLEALFVMSWNFFCFNSWIFFIELFVERDLRKCKLSTWSPWRVDIPRARWYLGTKSWHSFDHINLHWHRKRSSATLWCVPLRSRQPFSVADNTDKNLVTKNIVCVRWIMFVVNLVLRFKKRSVQKRKVFVENPTGNE